MIKKTKRSTKSKKSSTDSSSSESIKTKLTKIHDSFETIVTDLHDVISNTSMDPIISLSQHNKDLTLSELEKIVLEVKKSNDSQIDQYKERLNHFSSSFKLLISSLTSSMNSNIQSKSENSIIDDDYLIFEKNLSDFLHLRKKTKTSKILSTSSKHEKIVTSSIIKTFTNSLIKVKNKYVRNEINPQEVKSTYIYDHLLSNDLRKCYNYKQDPTIYHLHSTYTSSFYASLRKLLDLEKINLSISLDFLIEFRNKVLKQLEPSLMDHEKSIEDSLILSKTFFDYLVIYFKDK